MLCPFLRILCALEGRDCVENRMVGLFIEMTHPVPGASHCVISFNHYSQWTDEETEVLNNATCPGAQSR